MPTRTGKDTQGCFVRWGSQTKYYYKCGDDKAHKRAEAKANKQAAAIEISKQTNMKNNFKYIKNIADDKSEATILLYKPIGRFQDNDTGEMIEGIDGNQFANEMQFLEAQCVDTIHVKINSIGGSVLDGYSIISAIKNSSARICTYNDGLAASIAGLILIAGDERYAMDYAITMIHNPSGTENADILNKVKDSLVTILQNNSILSKEDLDKLMNEETYYTSEEAKAVGLIDKIISSSKKVKVETKDINEMAEIFNKLITDSDMKKNTKKAVKALNKVGIESPETLTNADGVKPEEEKVTKKLEENTVDKAEVESPEEEETDPNEEAEHEMGEDKVGSAGFIDKVKAHFGMDDDSTEEEVYDALKEHKAAHEDLKVEHTKLQDKLQTLADEAKKAHKEKINAMVNELFIANKITAAEKEGVTKLALVDFETTKNLFSKVNVTKAVKISNVISTEAPKAGTKAAWTHKDYEKNAPKELMEIKNTQPEVYKELFKASYGVYPK